MSTIRKPDGKRKGNLPSSAMAAAPKRCVGLLLMLCVLVAIAGCLGTGSSVSSMTWNGKKITVVGFNSVSMSALGDRAEIAVTGHKIVITRNAITVDGTKREASDYSQVKIAPADGGVEVVLDGSRPLFP